MLVNRSCSMMSFPWIPYTATIYCRDGVYSILICTYTMRTRLLVLALILQLTVGFFPLATFAQTPDPSLQQMASLISSLQSILNSLKARVANLKRSSSVIFTAQAQTADITTGLVGHWKFDEGSGISAADSSGNGNSGTVTNGPTWTTGKINSALSFDGTDDYVTLGTMDVPGSAVTIAMWVKADSFSSTIDTRFISKANSTAESGHWWMLGQTNSGGDKLRFRLKAGGSTATLIASSGTLPLNAWFHAVATYDGSTMRLYKDGVEVGSLAKSGALNTDSTIPVNIGRNPDGSNYMDGATDDVRIYNRTLSVSEISALYNYTGGTPHCSDGIDNDSDGRIDYPNDPGCTSSADPNETDPPPPDTTPPLTPTNLSATSQSSSQINLSWNASTDNVGVTGYRVERCQGSSCTNFTQIATPTGTTYNDTGLTANTTYRYQVRAVDAANNLSGYSSIVSGTTQTALIGSGGAPLRSGQPYAEATKCADPNVILCEDFNYPGNFYFSGTDENNNHRWTNPGLTTQEMGFLYSFGRQINPATQYATKPQGPLSSGSQSDHVWVSNWDPTKGITGTASTWGKIREPGGNYANNTPPTKEIYTRFQVYFTPNWAWPGDPKTDKYNWGVYPCVDNKIFGIFPSEGLSDPTSAAYGTDIMTSCGVYDPITGGRFANALVVRYGNNSDNNKHFPANIGATQNPQHLEYYYQLHGGALPLRNPDDVPIAISFNNMSNTGRLFRFNTDRWYTVEMRNRFSSAPDVRDGIVEIFIDGNRIYSANDLATCGSGLGDCSGVGAIVVLGYHNSSDATQWNGQQIVDNLIISKAYIGPPSVSIVDTTIPSAPTNLSATPQSSSQTNLFWSASTDNVGVTGYRVERCAGSTCTTFSQIATPTGTAYNDTGLAANTTYRYQVRATDAAGNFSPYSSIVNGTTQASTPPPTGTITLDDFSGPRPNPGNGNIDIISVYNGEDPGQTYTISPVAR